jgi:hypothetical protein
MSLLDTLSIPVIVALFAIVSLVCYEVGFRVGRWWQDREPGEQEGPTGVIVGGILGLMAFLLAITMGMASDRFDRRRGLVLEEANAISTAYLRADYLLQPGRDQLKELLRAYLPQRIATDDQEEVLAKVERSAAIHQQMWAIVAAAAQGGYSGDLVSSLGEVLTDISDLAEDRVVAGLYARVPETVLLLLLAGSTLSLAMLGYSAGLTGRRGLLSAVVLIIALGAVTALVIDLDRPQDGFLRVSQKPLLDVQRAIGTPSPPG